MLTTEEIDSIVRGIDARQESIKTAIAEMTGKPDNLLKVHQLLELTGAACGEMDIIRELLLEAKKKPVRKFALLSKCS
jgi:hypothetical protein